MKPISDETPDLRKTEEKNKNAVTKETADRTERMKELVKQLDTAAKAYYQGEQEIMSNYEYDALYDELLALEQSTGVVLAASPTQKIGYEVLSELPKEHHERVMQSLDKTKEISALEEFLGEKEALLSWKMDGLTVVLTYENGELFKAVTRGNGEVGEVITSNAKTFQNIPLKIPYQGRLVLRGEAFISYSDFEKINEAIENPDERYKNPRNLCSGSVRQLNSQITAQRNVKFYAFALVSGGEAEAFRSAQFEWLSAEGFEVVPYRKVTGETVRDAVLLFEEEIKTNDFPSDGLVLEYDDLVYGESLGRTAKFPRNAIAFKWADQAEETRLLEIEWSPSRTGLINPVAIFEPVELEGTTVKRASVHNLNMIEELELGIGDRIEVYKANMIIPQIAKNLTRSGNLEIPETCPACGGPTSIKKQIEVKSLYCSNPECPAKKVKRFAHMASRDALNIEGLSEATLEKLIGHGLIGTYSDIFHLDKHREVIEDMEGFGKRSYEKLTEMIEKKRETSLPRVIYGLGIPNIGLANAKLICKAYNYQVEKLLSAKEEELSEIDMIGEVIAQSFVDYFKEERNLTEFQALLSELSLPEITEEEEGEAAPLSGMTFVITGDVRRFPNRSALKEFIEEKGGKATGSVSAKTTYLINNDAASNSSKNKKAKELNIPILSEEDFLALLNK